MGRFRTVRLEMFDIALYLRRFENPQVLKTHLPADLLCKGVWVEPLTAQVIAIFESSEFDEVKLGIEPPVWNLEWSNWDVPRPTTPCDRILEEISLERARQQDQWGTDNHSISQWMLIITKHVGRLAAAGLEWGNSRNPEDAPRMVKIQAIKVAALCVALIEDWYAAVEGFGKKW